MTKTTGFTLDTRIEPGHGTGMRLFPVFTAKNALRVFFCILLLPAAVTAAFAAQYSLYGFEDEYGVVHLHDTRLDDRYVLIYESDERPKLGFDKIRKMLHKKGGRSKEVQTQWIKDNVTKWIPRSTAILHAKPPTKEMRRAITTYSARYGLDANLVYAVIEQESGFHPNAISPKGAQGLMQIMPETQRVFGLREPFDPVSNIATGTRYLRQLIRKFSNTQLALAAYNAGPGAVERHGGIPPYTETKNYVQRVMARYRTLSAGQQSGME